VLLVPVFAGVIRRLAVPLPVARDLICAVAVASEQLEQQGVSSTATCLQFVRRDVHVDAESHRFPMFLVTDFNRCEIYHSTRRRLQIA